MRAARDRREYRIVDEPRAGRAAFVRRPHDPHADADANDALLRQVKAELPDFISNILLFSVDGAGIGIAAGPRIYGGIAPISATSRPANVSRSATWSRDAPPDNWS